MNGKRWPGRRSVNRLLYAGITCFILIMAWIYGGSILYITLYTLLLLPLFSLVYAVCLWYGVRVAQETEQSVITRGEPGRYHIHVHNRTPFVNNATAVSVKNGRGGAENREHSTAFLAADQPVLKRNGYNSCVFWEDAFVIQWDSPCPDMRVWPFSKKTYTVEFNARCRGEYRLGLTRLEISGFLGLFTLRKKVRGAFTLTVMPRVADIPRFPLAELLSQSFSTFDVREEDYATISDIRPYQPDDSIKRVHWKLTARRGEWLVKNFQANALNRVSVLLNPYRRGLARETALTLEDYMVETSLAIVRYCLKRQLPVSFHAGGGVKAEGRLLSDFNAFYQMTSGIRFSEKDEGNQVLSMLEHCLAQSASYMNIIAATSVLDPYFCERAAHANNAGNLVAVLYFPAYPLDKESEALFHKMLDGGAAVYRMDEDTEYA